jgi:hypothetical protein
VFEDIGPTLQLAVYGERGFRLVDFSNWFFMFKSTLVRFVDMVRMKKPAIPIGDTLRILNVVAGARTSLEKGGAPVSVSERDTAWP